MAFFSWSNVSSLGFNNPAFHFIPFLLLWSTLVSIIHSKTTVDYLAFSLPLVLGFIYFQKLLIELSSEENLFECYLGSLFFIMSPIIIINQIAVFLTSVWLIGVLSGIFYYFIRYLKTENFSYVLAASFFSVIFSIALYAFPWIFGVIIPLTIALTLIAFFYTKKEIGYFIKKLFVFLCFLFFSQVFWILPFIASFTQINNSSISGRVLTTQVANTFQSTVLSTASGDVLYPLLNLFHRQIAFDYNWQVRNIYSNYYDKLFFVNSLFFIIIVVGILFRRNFNRNEQNIWLFAIFAFMLSLYFFTVNIGPLKYLFLFFGHIPGFVIFRNFYDKFALGYVFFYSLLLTLSMIVLRRIVAKRYYYFIILGVFMVIILDALPIKGIVNSPLWLTQSVYRTTNISPEYLDFVTKIKSQVEPTTNIFGVPFNIAAYAIVMDANDSGAYIGTSPVKIFTGVNDLTGSLSFPGQESGQVNDDILDRNYADLNNLFEQYNVNYILVTRNISNQMKNSYLFEPSQIKTQDATFLHAILGKKILSSSGNNYQLYTTKKQSQLFISKNLTYKKLNDTQYDLYITNLKSSQKLSFRQPFHSGWQLFLQQNPTSSWCGDIVSPQMQTTQCKHGDVWTNSFEFSQFFENPLFVDSHQLFDTYANEWTIDPKYIESHFDQSYYKKNSDGSISVELKLYFKPQSYFYVGTAISLFTFIACIGYLIYQKKYVKS